jgi:hypothetical protein
MRVPLPPPEKRSQWNPFREPLLTFVSLLPQGRPGSAAARRLLSHGSSLGPTSRAEPHHVFTISNAAVGAHAGILLRIDATVRGKPARCLIDCGATSDFVSAEFVRRHQLDGDLGPTQHRVRGYDGQLTPASGVLEAAVDLKGAGSAGGARQLLVAQLHSDDVILGLPWLASTRAKIDFEQPTVDVRGDDGVRRILALTATKADPSKAASDSAAEQLMQAVVSLYRTDTDDDASVGQSDIRETLREFSSPPQPPPDDPELAALCKKVLSEFKDVFPDKLPAGLPPGRGHELTIELRPNSKPPNRQPPRQNQKHAVFEAKWLKDMLANGHIQPSQSEYAAPHFYVSKADTATSGEYRAVTDFRLLNAQTVKNKYPLPRADQLFDKMAKAKYFSKIDLRTGFYQILIGLADRHKTAFVTSQGLFEYNVLPMGLCNSPGVFMALMNDTFREYLDKFVLVFLDDIIVYSDTLEEHERHLRAALQKLREKRLYAKLSKSTLCRTEVEFLGHYVGRDGLRVMEDKIEAVSRWPVPTSMRELRAFLGLSGYYRRFVRGFSEIALPLTELTRNATHQRLQWGARQQVAFVRLKGALQSTPVLALPDTSLPYVVNCDASGYAVGAVLQQDRGEGLQPIAFLSHKMSGAETRYPVHEQELLAIITALQDWRHYLSGTAEPIRIRTDHKSLIHFQTQPMLSGRQTRWLETLADFDYVIEYVKGEDNGVADALSRRSDLNESGAPDERPPVFIDMKKTFELNAIMVRSERLPLIDEINSVRAAQRRAPAASHLPLPQRQQEIRRLAERARAIETALRIRPAEAVQLAGPRPARTAGGSIITPTQRCTADNKKGAQCGAKTAKGQHCHVHMRSLEGLRVTASKVAGAGQGLLAARNFARGEHIADYTGDELIIREDGDGGSYCLKMSNRRMIDAAAINTGYGRWANDPRGSGGGPNAEFVMNPARLTGRLRTTQAVRAGEEIFVSYGKEYWKAFGRDAKVVARPARQPRRNVIDLSEVSASTFSSELADLFEAACAKDAKYAARLAEGDRQPTGEPDRVGPDELITRDGRLFTRAGGQLWVPNDAALRTRLIRECHDSATAGHLGRDKTLDQMKQRFFWSGMAARIEEYVLTCDACQKNKPSQRLTPGLLMPIAPPTRAFHTWTMDLITQLPKSKRGNDAIVVWVCKLTKLRHYAACKTAIDAPTLARLFLHTVVRMHGMPEVIISDRDPRFTAHFWRAFWASMGTTLAMSTGYHPQTDGQTENANKTLEIMLRSVVDFDQTDWDDHLDGAELAINNSKSETTGFTPFFLAYGQEARMPLDLALAALTKVADNPTAAEATARWRRALQDAFGNSARQQKRQKKYADRDRRELTFKVGDRVLLATENLKMIGEKKRARKFSERFIGPYRVVRVANPNAYELELPATLKIHPVINISHLKEYRDGTAAFPDRPQPVTRPEPEALDDNGTPAWEVRRLLDHRTAARGLRRVDQYLVEWVGYPITEATWEPIENLTGAIDLVSEFNREQNITLCRIETTIGGAARTFSQVAADSKI